MRRYSVFDLTIVDPTILGDLHEALGGEVDS